MHSKMKLIIFVCVLATAIAIRVPNSWGQLNDHSSRNKQSNSYLSKNANIEDVVDTSYEYISPNANRDRSGQLKTEPDDTYKEEQWIKVKSTDKEIPYAKTRNGYKKKHTNQPVGYRTVIYRKPNTKNIHSGPRIIIKQPFLHPSPPEVRPRTVPYRNDVPYISRRLPNRPPKIRVYRKESETGYPSIVYDPFAIKQNQLNNFLPIIVGINTLSTLTTNRPDKILDFNPFQSYQDDTNKQQHATLRKVDDFPQNVLRSIHPRNPYAENIDFNPFQNARPFFLNSIQNANEMIPKNHNPVYTGAQTFQNHLNKNYRDDKTHELSTHDPEYDTEEVTVTERGEEENAPVSIHEQPQEVPTRPIYPGEGKWAKPGIKHMPYISNQKYKELEDIQGKPDGYDTYVDGQQLFLRNKNQLGQAFDEFPEKHSLGNFLPKSEEEEINNDQQSEDEPEEANEDDEEEEFVPMKLYAQVRHSDHEEHLPSEAAEDGRLREVIKDSKIQTVYTEEGYEDNAYDHAGHEKNAEDQEGFAENERDVEGEREEEVPIKIPKIQLESTKYTKDGIVSDDNDEEISAVVEDSDTAGSHYTHPTYINKMKGPKKSSTDLKNNKQNFISTKETKTMTTKENENGNVEMEISGAIRVVVQPDNSTKPQKYIKVFPKVHKTMTKDYNSDDSNDEDREATIREVPQNRKSFDGDGIFIEEIITTPGSSNSSYLITIPTTSSLAVTSTVTDLLSDIFTMEIPTTTQATTAITTLNNLEQDTSTFIDINSKSRVKRFTNDFPKLDIDTQFIGKISHELGQPKPRYSIAKYPYYKKYDKLGLSEHSPLRYSENMENVPLKIGGDLAFYEQAESKMNCPEVEETIDPIPERVKNAENKDYEEYSEDAEDEAEDDITQAASTNVPDIAKAPRLQGLGDKIDCMKAKYFGENPLDSPFFQEEFVGPVKPIFEFNDKVKDTPKPIGINTGASTINNGNKLHRSPQVVEELPASVTLLNKDELLSPSDHQRFNEIDKFEGISVKTDIVEPSNSKDDNNIHNINKNTEKYDQSNVTIDVNISSDPTVAPINLLTTPKYTIDLKPKHIYHQIKLLNFLPDYENQSINNGSNDKRKVDAVTHVNVTENNNVSYPTTTVNKSEEFSNTSRQSKSLQLPSYSEIVASDTRNNNSNAELIPEAEALRRRKRIRLKQPLQVTNYMSSAPAMMPHYPVMNSPGISREENMMTRRRPPFQIFDVNKYLPSTQAPIFKDLLAQGTTLPKYKVVSEVFYKDEIKPNEQLNVLNDVINIIRNSSQEQLEDSSNDYSESQTVKLNPFQLQLHQNDNGQPRQNKNFKYNRDSYLKAYGDQEIDDKYDTSSSTTLKPIVTQPNIIQDQHHYQTIKYIQDSSVDKYRLRKKPNYKTTTTATTYEVTEPISQQNVDYLEGTTRVMGLLPPGSRTYNTVPNTKRDNSQYVSNYGTPEIKHMNKYWVMGMRPPPKQRIYAYSDFLNNNYLNRNKYAHNRGKRNANRGSYAQLSRNRNRQPEPSQEPEVAVDNDDDYVPHRPKNFHYDEKTGKIVYHSVKKPDDEDEELEEIVYEEIVEEPIQTEKPKQNPIFATATPPPEGKSYIDFVKKLKSATDYQLIPDPTTTEQAITPENVSTTLKPISTTPPEFLGILAKIRSNSEYKLIEDKKKVEKIMPASEGIEEEVEEEEEEEEEDQETRLRQNIKNSPGGGAYEIGRHFQIFDISDFIPKLRNYLPKTSVDTSKYKTIQRPTRINVTSDTAEEETSSTSIRPQVEVETKSKVEDTINSESQVLEMSSTTTSTTTEQLTTTPQRKRTRGRRPSTHLQVRAFEKETSSATTTEIPHAEVFNHDKARRTYRRRPTRIQRPTTEKFFEQEVDDTTKILRRRSGIIDRRQINLDKLEQDDTSREIPNNKEGISEIPNQKVSEKANVNVEQPKSAVEVFQKIDPNRKHGGNYRSVNEKPLYRTTTPKQKYIPNYRSEQLNNVKVEIVGDYDKNNKHGGNYQSDESYYESYLPASNESDEGEAREETVEGQPEEEPLIINLLLESEGQPSVDSKRTASADELNSRPGKRKRRKKPQKKFNINTNVQRLTDVVPKPETYYSDPNLPIAVNMLMDIHLPNKDVVYTIDKDSRISTDGKNVSGQNRVKQKITRPKIEQNKPDNSNQKLPKIIKDPSKRLYFYAPL